MHAVRLPPPAPARLAICGLTDQHLHQRIGAADYAEAVRGLETLVCAAAWPNTLTPFLQAKRGQGTLPDTAHRTLGKPLVHAAMRMKNNRPCSRSRAIKPVEVLQGSGCRSGVCVAVARRQLRYPLDELVGAGGVHCSSIVGAVMHVLGSRVGPRRLQQC